MLENVEIANLRVTKLRAYLMDIITELIGQYGEMNINFLSNEPNNYSLDKIKEFGVLYKKYKNKRQDFVNILRQKNKNPRSREMAAGI